MSEPLVVGLKPWFPSWLPGYRWLSEPVRAERLAALRSGVGLVLLLDVLCCYLPFAGDLFGTASLGAPEVFSNQRPLPAWPWSLLVAVEAPVAWQLILTLWALTAVALIMGVCPRLAAALAWLLAGSIHYVNPWLFNAGDSLRHILLFYLMLSPSDAVWSLARRRVSATPILVPPWALRLLFVQLIFIYFSNGIAKLGPQWLAGETVYYVMSNLSWTRWSAAAIPVPYPLTQLFTWITLVWELTFPIFVIWPRTRAVTLWVGVLFHLGTGVALKIFPFPLYALCFYLPFLPWERWADRAERLTEAVEETGPLSAATAG